jgi:hypothetical protein
MPLGARLNRLRKKYLLCRGLTAAAKADSENELLIAAVNRCATQNQVQHTPSFSQAVKVVPFPVPFWRASLAWTAEGAAVPT